MENTLKKFLLERADTLSYVYGVQFFPVKWWINNPDDPTVDLLVEYDKYKNDIKIINYALTNG